jgi:hypothetical protein
MVHARELAARFEAYGDWRRRLSAGISALHDWLSDQDLADAQIDLRVQRLLERLHQDKLVVAFVAEFSRGKSELINAIFFADFGARLLPSAAGRTTMCPTEILHDPSRPPSIRLLPIETRLKDGTVAELKGYADEWVSLPLDLASAERMTDALARVSQVKRVPVALARRYGLHDEDLIASFEHRDVGSVDIPCWRHAIINFPAPALEAGASSSSTRRVLNAIGTEPELTLSLLPSAHAVLFILAADAGVTKTDLDVWKDHLAGADETTRAGRLVILNKIDGLWDDMKSPAEIESEIQRQIRTSAEMLSVPVEQVFPVSAQKALLAKVNGDDTLLARSRLPRLESALSGSLVRRSARSWARPRSPTCARWSAACVRSSTRARPASSSSSPSSRRCAGKNQDVVEHMMQRVRDEKAVFERGLSRYSALRNVFTQQTTELYDLIGLEALRANASRTRKSIEASLFTKGVRGAMNDFFAQIRADLDASGKKAGEIHEMMVAMYARFAKEHNLDAFSPPPFSMLKYLKEVERLERAYQQHINTLWNMASKAKFPLMRRFFETVASRVKHLYDIANRDVEAWLKSVMSPLETQVREHQMQLRRRLESIKRIHRASDELEERVAELNAQREGLDAQSRALDARVGDDRRNRAQRRAAARRERGVGFRPGCRPSPSSAPRT